MALTVDITYRDRDGQMLRTFADVTFDSSLVAGGESLTPQDLGMNTMLREVRVSGDHDGFIVQYNYTTQELTAYQETGNAGALDEADTVDLDSITECKIVAIGY